ncbi:MAG: formylglycine-generating enzyme family protein [Methylococcaceae bacterium]|nr:formylglycine-generating enzyme family protein [Methylococcaceae bacterium]
MRVNLIHCLLVMFTLCVVSSEASAKPEKSSVITYHSNKAGAFDADKHSGRGEDRKFIYDVSPPQQAVAIIPAISTIPSGCFQMGSLENEPGRGGDEALHRVCVKGFKLAKTEVTIEEFSRFVEATHFLTDAENNYLESGCWSYEKNPEKPWDWRALSNWKQPILENISPKNHPVTCVSYNDVMAYIEWLNKESGHEYRLPTEAEWEYAARAGTSTAHYWGNNADIACGYANVADNTTSDQSKWPVTHACQDGHFFAAAVKSFSANGFHLYDMLGNAWEWVCSKYEDKYAGNEEACINTKPDDEVFIAIRGGGWNADASRVRAAHRNWGVAWSRQANLGFRLVRVR